MTLPLLSGPENTAGHVELHVPHGHNAAAAEDLSQEVFLRVYRSRENYEPTAKLRRGCTGSQLNLAVNHARDTRHDRPENMASLDEPDEESGQTMDVADESLTVEQNIIRQERMKSHPAKVQGSAERQRMASSCISISRWTIARLQKY